MVFSFFFFSFVFPFSSFGLVWIVIEGLMELGAISFMLFGCTFMILLDDGWMGGREMEKREGRIGIGRGNRNAGIWVKGKGKLGLLAVWNGLGINCSSIMTF